jgi:hypothetical protein
MIVYMWMSDFIMRGSDVPELFRYQGTQLVAPMQILILLFVIVLYALTFLIATQFEVKQAIASVKNERIDQRLALLPVAVLIVDLIIRFHTSHYDISTVIEYSFGKRYSSPWQAEMDNATTIGTIYRFISELSKLSGLAFAYFLFRSHGPWRVLVVIGFLVSFSLLVGLGSRTPVALSLGAVVVMALLNLRSVVAKGLIVAGVSALAVLTFSAQYLTRSAGGIASIFDRSSGAQYSVVYHQDNNFYLSIRSLIIATYEDYRWDWIQYFKLILSQPIPRAIYTGKPLMTDNFVGPFGKTYLTFSIVGDGVALFGVVGGIVYALILGVALFILMLNATRALKYQLGIMLYLSVALYVYMVLRSSMNLTFFMYLPLAMAGFFWAANRRGSVQRRRRALAASVAQRAANSSARPL